MASCLAMRTLVAGFKHSLYTNDTVHAAGATLADLTACEERLQVFDGGAASLKKKLGAIVSFLGSIEEG